MLSRRQLISGLLGEAASALVGVAEVDAETLAELDAIRDLDADTQAAAWQSIWDGPRPEL